MTPVEAASLVALIANSFPNQRFPDETAAIYESKLLPLDARATHAAINELISTSRFLPTIADIRGEMVRAARDQARTAEAARALRLGDGSGDINLPPPHAWVAPLTRMLEASARYRAGAEVWYAAKGKPVPPDPALPYIELARAAARGEDVRESLRREVLPGDQSELDRRFP